MEHVYRVQRKSVLDVTFTILSENEDTVSFLKILRLILFYFQHVLILKKFYTTATMEFLIIWLRK